MAGVCVNRGDIYIAAVTLVKGRGRVGVGDGDGDAYYWPLPLSRAGRCSEVSIKVNGWEVGREEKSWRGEVPVIYRELAVREVRLYGGQGNQLVNESLTSFVVFKEPRC